MRQMQASARAAVSSSVPDGLVVGGLNRLTRDIYLQDGVTKAASPKWEGADLPVQNGTTVTIKQTKQQALLHWETFNVGKATTVDFNQDAGGKDSGKWIVFNKIFDPSAAPSMIFGTIRAAGQVYLINQNGIIFGGSSQVNTHTLVASSLPINATLVANGLLNNPGALWLFDGSNQSSLGDIWVQPGAQLSCPSSADHSGGRVALIGLNVRNAGEISTPNGQTILAAGTQVGMASHDSNDPSFRGLDVFVGAAGAGGMSTNAGLIETMQGNAVLAGKSVYQMGVIDSSTSVSLNGRIDIIASYDAVSNPNFQTDNSAPFLFKQSGRVVLGPSSVTRILPEWESPDKISGTRLSLSSMTRIQGGDISLLANAMVLAPSASKLPDPSRVAVGMEGKPLGAGVTLEAGSWDPASQNYFAPTTGSISMESGAFIDVSGSTNVSTRLADLILTLKLRNPEFANSPLQRKGALRSTSLTVDSRVTGTYGGLNWYGTPLGDVSGYVGLIKRSVSELTTAGGTISLSAGKSVTTEAGSSLDVSGGWMSVKGAQVSTTKVIRGGNLLDISDATPDLVYNGIFSGTTSGRDAKWGITKTFHLALAPSNSHFEPGYIQGANAGQITVSSPTINLRGDLAGRPVVGPRQLRSSSFASGTLQFSSSLPAGGTLGLNFKSKANVAGLTGLWDVAPLSPPNIFVAADGGSQTAGATFGPVFSAGGFSSLLIEDSEGSLTIKENERLALPAGGTFQVSAKNIDIQGQITAPGGAVNLTAYNYSPYRADILTAQYASNPSSVVLPVAQNNAGQITMGPQSAITTAGLLVDDRLAARASSLLPLTVNGGTISLAGYSVSLAAGSLLDVSGGAYLPPADITRKFGVTTVNARSIAQYGKAGNISLLAGKDPKLSLLGGQLTLGATLNGYSGSTSGGGLEIQTGSIWIGAENSSGSRLSLSPDFFNQGGFSSFTLRGIGVLDIAERNPGVISTMEVSVAPGTVIRPVVSQSAIVPLDIASGLVLRAVVRPEGLRPSSSITLQAPGVVDSFSGLVLSRGDISMGTGSQIIEDPLSSFSASGQTVQIDGGISVPGGVIAIQGGKTKDIDPAPSVPLVTVILGSNAHLDAAGTTVVSYDSSRQYVGEYLFGGLTRRVLPGGSIQVAGNIFASPGSLLDVSGSSSVLSLPLALTTDPSFRVPASSGVTSPVYSLAGIPTRVDTSGGTIALNASELMISEAKLLGEAGGSTALGGTLDVKGGVFYLNSSQKLDVDVSLAVSQSNTGISAVGSRIAIGKPVVQSNGGILQPLTGTITSAGVNRSIVVANPVIFAVDQFTLGGFSSLVLEGNVRFTGAVLIAAPIMAKVATGGVLFADSTVAISAPYVALGKPFHTPISDGQTYFSFSDGTSAFALDPSYGTGRLTVESRLLDIGDLSLQGIGSANLRAEGGDIRGSGTLDIAGHLILAAREIYPVTGSAFTAVAYDYGGRSGTIDIQSTGGVPHVPLSAGGTLRLFASQITQAGDLSAPFGTIVLGWDGTGTKPVDSLANNAAAFPTTNSLVLAANSITSVSAVDSKTGVPSVIPYGLISKDGASWISPSGVDISTQGLPQKQVTLSAANISTEAGSVINVRGGGDMYAYQWLEGQGGGTQDILDSSAVGSFAIIPGYRNSYAPYAPFNDLTAAFSSSSQQDIVRANLGTDLGYFNSSLKPGDQVYLEGYKNLAAGFYTLLPARYALLPGALLVTPQSKASPLANYSTPDGAYVISGTKATAMGGSEVVANYRQRFEVADASVVRSRADYADFFASSFFPAAAMSKGSPSQLLPGDSGYLLFSSTASLHLGGAIQGHALGSGRGAYIDINSSLAFQISDTKAVAPGVIWLEPSLFNGSGVESLLIGGVRAFHTGAANLTVNTNEIVVNNSGNPLVAPEVILASKGGITLGAGSSIESSGLLTNPGDTLQVSGPGTLLRVSGDAQAGMQRTGDPFTLTSAVMTVSSGVVLRGAGLTLDSTYATNLDPTAALLATGIALDSGQISLRFANSGPLQSTAGLVLDGTALAAFEAATYRSLLSYSSIDIYGNGAFGTRGSGDLTMSAGEIRRRDNNLLGITIGAANLVLTNTAGSASVTTATGATSGTLTFAANTIELRTNQMAINGYWEVVLDATGGFQGQGTDGLPAQAFSTQGALAIKAPILTGSRGSQQRVAAGGILSLLNNPASAAQILPDVGGSLLLAGSSITGDASILLPSGILSLSATDGDIVFSGKLDVSGKKFAFSDAVRYTDGGQVNLSSAGGDIVLAASSRVSVAADPGGGNAGTLAVSTPFGQFASSGTLDARGGKGGAGGSFALDTASLPDLSSITDPLVQAAFSQSIALRVRTGDVSLPATARTVQSREFQLSADSGDIAISGAIDASGDTGGTITLVANGSVILQTPAILNVEGKMFDSAGKGGQINLEAGSQRNGVMGAGRVTIASGSQMLLGVATVEDVSGDLVPSLVSSSEALGKFTGTLHIRAPQDLSSPDLIRVDAINGLVKNASNILVEGYQLFDLTNTDGTITNTGSIVASPAGPLAADVNVQGSIQQNGANFLAAANDASIAARLLASNSGLNNSRFVLAPGAEVIKGNGDLILGTSSSSSASDWDLGTFRFGPKNVPGVLTLRAAGDLVFYNTLSDGFTALSSLTPSNGYSALWLAPLMAAQATLPGNLQSWSYVLSSGADLSAANRNGLQSMASLDANPLLAGKGSFLLGKTFTASASGGLTATTSSLIGTYSLSNFQVVRTGTGDIQINAGRNVELLNQFASIYTAGVQVADPTLGGAFVTPTISYPLQTGGTAQAGVAALGKAQQGYGVYYGLAGGSVSVFAQNDIRRPQASLQMPTNWLYRRGYVDSNGNFAATSVTTATGSSVVRPSNTITDAASSTTWWVDFSNFFEGVGTLSGGKLSLSAGNDIVNVDAVAPTNARMPGLTAGGSPAEASASNLIELGGGDVTVRAGRNIDGGTYYVENGSGILSAGTSITTNSQRSLTRNTASESVIDWLPTTLFVGKGNFQVSALGDIRLGPVANPFLLPAGVGDPYWLATYFSTYSPRNSVSVTSLAGDVTFATKTYNDILGSVPWLWAWYDTYLANSSSSQPWLRLNTARTDSLDAFNTDGFKTAAGIMPATVLASAISGNINLAGSLTLGPSATGNIELVAAGSLNGFQPVGSSSGLKVWASSTINVSDADANAIPSVFEPVATYKAFVDTGTLVPHIVDFLQSEPNLTSLSKAFAESGATENLVGQQGVHSPGPLHRGDTSPTRLYAGAGSIQGVSFFSPKFSRIFAGQDIRDVEFYLQNADAKDTSVVAAGNNIILFDDNSPLLVQARQAGNTAFESALKGDLQIGGPGALEILAGRNLDIGAGLKTTFSWRIFSADGTSQTQPIAASSKQAALQIALSKKSAGGKLQYPWLSDNSVVVLLSKLDGTGQGITSIGNLRNSYLSSEGARLILAAGIGMATSLFDSNLDFSGLTKASSAGASSNNPQAAYDQLDTFFRILRDAGRAYSKALDPSAYASGFAAISKVFGDLSGSGDILTESRDIRTKNGGDISILVPGGKLDLGLNSGNNPDAPSGIVTASGGGVSIFADGDVNIGKGRIFTLRGGNIVIWSSAGNIAAGREKTTVQTAPPTGVLYDTGSADVRTNLGGLATGGGIGVLASVEGVPPGDVDLIAPTGVVDAGDAGIRVTGNLNIAATKVLNAENITAGGSSAGVPSTPTASAPNIGGLTSASSSSSAASSAANSVSNQARENMQPVEDPPSIITVEILGYGGGDSDEG